MVLFARRVRQQKDVLNPAGNYLSVTVASTRRVLPQAPFSTKQGFLCQSGIGLFSLWQPRKRVSQCFICKNS